MKIIRQYKLCKVSYQIMMFQVTSPRCRANLVRASFNLFLHLSIACKFYEYLYWVQGGLQKATRVAYGNWHLISCNSSRNLATCPNRDTHVKPHDIATTVFYSVLHKKSGFLSNFFKWSSFFNSINLSPEYPCHHKVNIIFSWVKLSPPPWKYPFDNRRTNIANLQVIWKKLKN